MSDGTAAAAPAGTQAVDTGGAPGVGSDAGVAGTPATGTTPGGATEGAAAGTPSAAAAAGTAATPAAVAGSDSGADWRSSITDPDHLEFAKRVSSVAELAKVGADFRRANSAMTRVPGKDASAEEIAKFNKLIGIPATASEYKFELGREPTDQDKAVQSKLAEVLLANRVPAEAAPALSKAVNEIAAEIRNEQNRVAVQARENSTAELRKELGADYDSHVVLAGRAVQQWGTPGFNDLLNKAVDGVKLGDHPDFVRVFGSIGRRMGEGGFIGAVGGTERQSLQSELNDIYNKTPPGSAGYASPEVQRRVTQIHETLHGTAAVGVGGGR